MKFRLVVRQTRETIFNIDAEDDEQARQKACAWVERDDSAFAWDDEECEVIELEEIE